MKIILYRNNSKTQSSHLKTKSAFLWSFTRVAEPRCSTNETNWCENDSWLGNSESNCVLDSKVSWKSPQLPLVHDWSISANSIFKYVIIPITSPIFRLRATMEMGEIFMWSALGCDNYNNSIVFFVNLPLFCCFGLYVCQ